MKFHNKNAWGKWWVLRIIHIMRRGSLICLAGKFYIWHDITCGVPNWHLSITCNRIMSDHYFHDTRLYYKPYETNIQMFIWICLYQCWPCCNITYCKYLYNYFICPCATKNKVIYHSFSLSSVTNWTSKGQRHFEQLI